MTSIHSLACSLAATALLMAGPALAAANKISTFSATQNLSFGTFAPGSAAGTVVVSTAGSRSSTGGVALLSSGPGAAARFSVVSNNTNVSYTVTLPSSATMTSGANSMTVNNFTSNPSTTASAGNTGSSKTQTLTVGATLNVPANQPTGSYTGSFSVTVNYP